MPRLPRFKRSRAVRQITLTERDKRILEMVHEHRFLRSNHIVALGGGSAQSILRRLQLLFHHGYLARPRIQLEYFGQGGSKALAYGIGSKGANLLRQSGVRVRRVRWNEKNQTVKRVFLKHALATSDFMVALEIACRGSGQINYIPPSALLNNISASSFHWRVDFGRNRLGVVPDSVFALDNQNDGERRGQAWFFLEVDRGTMPVKRKNFDRTSMYRKFVAYHATWKQRIYEKEFGFGRMRVIIVTTTPGRLRKLVETCESLPGGRRLFLLADRKTLARNSNLFAEGWCDGNGEPSALWP